MASASIQIHGFTITTFATSRETPKFTSSNSLFFGSTRRAKSARLTATVLKGRRTGPVRAVAEKVSGVDEVEKMVIEKMVNDAERFAKEEKEKRNSIYAKKHAESVVYRTENQLKNVGENVLPSVRDKVEAKLGALKDATSGGVTETIKDAIAAVNNEVVQMSSELSSSSSSSSSAEVKVTAKNMHVSVFKARRVLEQIRGRSYEDALMILELMPYRASYPILKLVYSAAANGTHNLDLKESDAYIKRAEANDGPFVKKMRPRARGRGSAIKKLTSHVTVVMGWRNS